MMKKMLLLILSVLLLVSCGGSGGGGSDSDSSNITWKIENASGLTDDDLEDIIWCDTLSKFVAVGGSTVTLSSDGVDWDSNEYGFYDSWGLTAITYNQAQQQFVSVGYWGDIVTSDDGVTWTEQADLAATLSGIACSDNLYVAVGSDDELGGAVYTSGDGSTWEKAVVPQIETLMQVIWNGSLFVAVGWNGTIATSADGSAWSLRESETTNNLYGIAWNGSFFIAVGDSGTVLKSSDGFTWTDISPSEFRVHLGGIVWGGDRFAAITTYDGYIVTSADGESADTFNTGSNAMFYAIAWNGSRFVVVGSEQTIIIGK